MAENYQETIEVLQAVKEELIDDDIETTIKIETVAEEVNYEVYYIVNSNLEVQNIELCKSVSNNIKGDEIMLFECDICGKLFRRKYNLKLHILSHAEERYLTCKICKKSFRSKRVLNLHLVSHSENKLQCHLCDRRLKTKCNLKCHLERFHLLSQKKIKCTICKQLFHTKHLLESHMVTHSDQREFQCGLCGKAFKTKQTLKGHMISHSNIRPFKCEICSKTFKSAYRVKIHSFLHSKSRIRTSYKCDICGQVFEFENYLKAHYIAMHPGNKNFACGLCNQNLQSLEELKVHLETKCINYESIQSEFSVRNMKPLKTYGSRFKKKAD